MAEDNGRTHEPNLREITAELDGFKEWVESELKATAAKSDERDRRYEQSFQNNKEAVASALAAQKELTGVAFAASEKAVLKAEEAQREYNVRSNEFRGQLDDQAKLLMPRTEAMFALSSLDGKIADLRDRTEKDLASLRESRSEGAGSKAGSRDLWVLIAGAIGLSIGLFSFMSDLVKNSIP